MSVDGRREVVWLPVPRVVVASCRRCAVGSSERLAVTDRLPVDVRSVTASEAPVVLRLGEKVKDPANLRCSREWRLVDGHLVRPLDLGVDPEGVEPDDMYRHLVHKATYAIGIDPMQYRCGMPRPPGEEVLPYEATFSKVSRSRGMREDLADHPVREVLSDGTGNRDAFLAAVRDNLVLVDGIVHHRSPVPRYTVTDGATGVPTLVRRTVTPYLTGRDDAPYVNPADPWREFGPGREGDAEAFARAVVEDMGPRGELTGGFAPLVVVDHDAFARSPAAETRATFVRRAAPALARRFAGLVGHADDATVAAFVELRRADAADVEIKWFRIRDFTLSARRSVLSAMPEARVAMRALSLVEVRERVVDYVPHPEVDEALSLAF